MKKFISLLLVMCVVLFNCCSVTFAGEIGQADLLTQPYYKYNNQSILYTDSSATTEATDVTMHGGIYKHNVNNNLNYCFKPVENNSEEQPFLLLDSSGEGDNKKYFILAGNDYGKKQFHSTSSAAAYFNPSNPNCVAYWLNNDFKSGTSVGEDSPHTSFYQGFNDYIDTEHLWWTEGVNIENAPHKDAHQIQAGIALLSYTEFMKYHNILGTKGVNGTSLYMWLRTGPIGSSSRAIRISPSSSGVVTFYYTETGSTSTFRVRPCFWITRDYFKNVKLDVATMGSEVKKMLLSDYTIEELSAVYSSEELAQIGVEVETLYSLSNSNMITKAQIAQIAGKAEQSAENPVAYHLS